MRNFKLLCVHRSVIEISPMYHIQFSKFDLCISAGRGGGGGGGRGGFRGGRGGGGGGRGGFNNRRFDEGPPDYVEGRKCLLKFSSGSQPVRLPGVNVNMNADEIFL